MMVTTTVHNVTLHVRLCSANTSYSRRGRSHWDGVGTGRGPSKAVFSVARGMPRPAYLRRTGAAGPASLRPSLYFLPKAGITINWLRSSLNSVR